MCIRDSPKTIAVIGDVVCAVGEVLKHRSVETILVFIAPHNTNLGNCGPCDDHLLAREAMKSDCWRDDRVKVIELVSVDNDALTVEMRNLLIESSVVFDAVIAGRYDSREQSFANTCPR